MNNKTLGSLALAGAPFMLLSSFLQPYFTFMHEQQFYGSWGVIYITAWMCSIRGLQRLQATGRKRFGKIILWIMMGFLLLANLSNAYQIIVPGSRSSLFIALDSFWPLSNLFMLFVSITIAIVGQLKGWRRFAPLVMGFWFPTLVVCMNIFGRTGITGTIAGVYSAIALSLLAWVVRTAKEEPEVVYEYKSTFQLS